MLRALFGNKTQGAQQKPDLKGRASDKLGALISLLRQSDGHIIRIYDRTLEPRIFARTEVMRELSLFLADARSRLEIYTDAQTIKAFTDHPHHRLVNKARASSCIQLQAVDTPFDSEFIWSGNGCVYVQVKDGTSFLFETDENMHRRVGDAFDALRQRRVAVPSMAPVRP